MKIINNNCIINDMLTKKAEGVKKKPNNWSKFKIKFWKRKTFEFSSNWLEIK